MKNEPKTRDNMKQVTAEEWGDFLLPHRCYGTELTRSTLDHLRSSDGFHLATVSYASPEKTYWVTTRPVPPEPSRTL